MITKVKNFFGHAFTIEGLIHVVMLMIAFGSFGTIREWLAHGHHWITTYSVAGGLSLGLVGVAIMLSKVDFNDKRTLAWMTGAVVAVALLSGTIQSIAYYDAAVCPVVDHVQVCREGTFGDIAKSMLQGYGFPLVFEGLLAYAASMFELSQKRKREAEAADMANIDRKMDAKIHEAIGHIDLSAMQDKVNAMAMSVVEAKLVRAFNRINGTDNQIDSAVVSLTKTVSAIVSEATEVVSTDKTVNPKLSEVVNPVVSAVSTGGDKLSEQVSEVVSPDTFVNVELSELSEDLSEQVSEVVSTDKSSDKSVNPVVSLTDQIVNVVSEHLTLGASDIHRLIGGDSVCSRPNVYNYLKQLEAAGQIVKVGSKYQTAEIVMA